MSGPLDRQRAWKSVQKQVVAAEHLEFRSLDGREVSVRGWPDFADKDDQREWIERFSDHALLYFEVQPIG